jgi:hypothetical protein
VVSSGSTSPADSSVSESELEEVETVDLVSSDDEVKKERPTRLAGKRGLPTKNKTEAADRDRADFFDFLGKYPIVALERCPSQLSVHKKVVENKAVHEERILELPGYPQLRISLVKSS